MGTGRPQKGMSSRNHHDNRSNSGQQSFNRTPKPGRGKRSEGSMDGYYSQRPVTGSDYTHGPGKRKKR